MIMCASGWVLLASVLPHPAQTIYKAFGRFCTINHSFGFPPSRPGMLLWAGVVRAGLMHVETSSCLAMWGETLGTATSPAALKDESLYGGGDTDE